MISVVLSTYNAEEWLGKVLWGYYFQTFKDFEIVIADDGSSPKTKALINQFQSDKLLNLQHVWQADDGFQKSKILNKGLLATKGSYIVMSDGDCIPRKDFLEIHNKYKNPGYFLSGGYFMLPMNISEVINKQDIELANCFELKWLSSHGLGRSFKNNKLTARGLLSKVLNKLTPTKATWNGHNSSGWKKDLLAVNGFDERMQYGGQDRELGERLWNYGIKSKQIRYSAICVHLDHPRGYKTQSSIDKNMSIRNTTKKENKSWTDFGIQHKS